MEDRKRMLKSLKSSLNPLLRSIGFTYQKPTILLRQREDVLHVISLHVSSAHVMIDYAIQPLYIKGNGIYLTCGDRLDRFVDGVFRGWGTGDESQFERDCEEICCLLNDIVVPMFEQFGTSSGLICFVEDGVWRSFTQGFSPDHRCVHLAYSYWYIGDVDNGISALSRVFDCGLDRSMTRVQSFLAEQQRLIRIGQENPSLIREEMRQNVTFTRHKLGLFNSKL